MREVDGGSDEGHTQWLASEPARVRPGHKHVLSLLS